MKVDSDRKILLSSVPGQLTIINQKLDGGSLLEWRGWGGKECLILFLCGLKCAWFLTRSSCECELWFDQRVIGQDETILYYLYEIM